MMQPKRRKPSTGKRKPAPVTLANAMAFLRPAESHAGGKPGVAANPAAESGDGAPTGEKSGGDA